MLFNSIQFVIFFPVVFFLYWFVFKKTLLLQNLFLVIASYVFYGWWDWRFLLLLIFSSFFDYGVGLVLEKERSERKRKLFFILSLIVNLGILGFFKYFNFFIDNFSRLFNVHDVVYLQVLLPVGVSFYTFQSLTYSIDVYYRRMPATHNLFAYLAYVSFFPQLVAGPIERAKNLLPQFCLKRKFDSMQAADGMRQILWGLFKKVVVADNCSPIVNDIFRHYTQYGSLTLIAGVLLFAFQIYGDFSGYSDIALGSARLMGFSLKRNFAFPYFSRDIAEFWRRWHISLSSWFRDYVYMPLGGSHGPKWKVIRNTFIIFLLSGFWHGANWTFIYWGFINAFYFLPLLLRGKNRKNLDIAAQGKILPSLKEFFQIIGTFLLVCYAWVFFRSENLAQAYGITRRIFRGTHGIDKAVPLLLVGYILILVIVEWVQRNKQHGMELNTAVSLRPYRWSFYFIIAVLVGCYFGNSNSFIYFQF